MIQQNKNKYAGNRIIHRLIASKLAPLPLQAKSSQQQQQRKESQRRRRRTTGHMPCASGPSSGITGEKTPSSMVLLQVAEGRGGGGTVHWADETCVVSAGMRSGVV